MFKCPICNSSLAKTKQSYVCPNSHNFDISKRGYVNLIPCNQKNSKDPGDSKEMMDARDRFLQKGFYKIISDSLNDFIFKHSQDILKNKSVNISETGCGSGYYLVNLKNFLSKDNVNYYGLDISKHAIDLGSRFNKDIKWVVANSYNIPFLDNSQDIIINIFAPYKVSELIRVLKPKGKVYFVIPGKNHLNTIRDAVYKNHKNEKSDAKLISNIENFNILKIKNSIEIEHELSLSSNEDIMSLLTMTPYYWNMNLETLNYFKSLNEITLTLDVIILEVEK